MNLIMAHFHIRRCGNFLKLLKQNSFKVVYQMAGQVDQGGIIASPGITLTATHLQHKLPLSLMITHTHFTHTHS